MSASFNGRVDFIICDSCKKTFNNLKDSNNHYCPALPYSSDQMKIQPRDNYDAINPSHYKDNGAKCKCGLPIECIDVTKHLTFVRGNAIKYLWRADLKGDVIENLKKARWYIDCEIRNLEREKS